MKKLILKKFNHMFQSSTSPVDWAKHYNIEVDGVTCSDCGHKLRLIKPLVFK